MGFVEQFLRQIVKSVVYCYRRFIKPYKKPCCRFYPSCSEYALMALDHHGAFRGTALIVWRLLRCHPLHPGGYDPIKPRKQR